ncbi:SAVED domain-containing protein [Myxococcus sp. CA040A]|uniref:SAVED domain-containing protein n=1 Tax=Myxococcus sp. CA040A TaxID=2741738 RepID=UPI00157B0B1F|nr:SAVED domain-containing protein [Myxococcus sp. CA040A]NTX07575.1 SAVED domain-containing protein [Myxococcus sp. CA040A]
MSAVDTPLEIVLEFTSVSSDFSWRPKEYFVKPTHGAGDSIRIPWPALQKELDALMESEQESVIFERFGQRLRKLLMPSDWALAEEKIIHAIAMGEPVHLTIRSKNADEIFYLPWEVLWLKDGRRLGGMKNCLIQYEVGSDTSREPKSQPMGRLLFAYSAAGGWVPSEAHLDALSDACQDAGLYFDPGQDVLKNVTRRRLVEKMEEPGRPITALHLLCHGARRDERGGSFHGLVFDPMRTEDGEPDFVDASVLRALLFSANHSNSLRLVTLCACQGGDSGTPGYLVQSNARMFHGQGVPAVLASRLQLSCSGSVTFTKTLYRQLLVGRQNMRTALSAARTELLHKERSSDWIALQFYARAGDAHALLPFSEPPPQVPTSTKPRELVLIRHEAYSTAHGEPTQQDAPTLFAGLLVRPVVSIDQASRVSERRWENLEPEVAKLAARDGVLRRLFDERDTDIVYFGFPYVSFAVLAGYLAKTRPVHVLEHDRNTGRFTWQQEVNGPAPQLRMEAAPGETGSVARVRLSISADVRVEECEKVLPASDVRMDLHFSLEKTQRGIVRREAQLLEYAQLIREAIDSYIAGNGEFESVHVFAAVPVSIAFHLGRALAFTGLPECFVYNFDGRDAPSYKWRMNIQAAAEGRPAITVFPS